MPSAGSAVGRAVQGRKLPPLPSLPRSRLLFSSSSAPAHHRNRASGPVQAGQFRSPRPGPRFRLPFGLGDGCLWAVCVARAQRPIRFDSASQRLLSLSVSQSVLVRVLPDAMWMVSEQVPSISRCIISPFNLSLTHFQDGLGMGNEQQGKVCSRLRVREPITHPGVRAISSERRMRACRCCCVLCAS